METLFSLRRLLTLAAAFVLVFGLAACDGLDPLGDDRSGVGDVRNDDARGDDGADDGVDDLAALEAALMSAPVTMTPRDLQQANASASGDDVVCTGPLGAVSIDGNVIVPSGARCQLNRTRIDGNVFVNTNAILIARGVEVGGNIQSVGSFRGVLVRDDRGTRAFVGGSVQLFQGDQAGVGLATVDSDVQLEQNDGRIVLTRNSVDGNMQVNQNTGGVEITRNVIQGALQCQSNAPPPTGGGNQAGDKEGQCTNL